MSENIFSLFAELVYTNLF